MGCGNLRERDMETYRKAIEQGHAEAQPNLGSIYDKGDGVSGDDAEVAKWLCRQ